ncbi:MAG: hypothetical protein DDT20_01705 [Firmicutes bacterium]|nr:hypothetical protein [Bacillota bacterium]
MAASWFNIIDSGDEAIAAPLATSGAAGSAGTSGGRYALTDHRHAFTPAQDLSMAGFKLTSLGVPTSTTDAANKAYVDATAVGIDWKASVRLATAAAPAAYTRAANIITFGTAGSQSVDGVATVINNRLLLKNGAAGADNGVYTVTTKGTTGVAEVWTRGTDADTDAEVTSGLSVFVEEGTSNADSGWLLTTDDPITLNTTALTFTQFTGIGSLIAGAGLTRTGSTVDVIAADATIVVNADSIQAGVMQAANLAAGSVIAGKIGAGAIVNADIAAGAAIALSKLAADPLARANHTGTQTASTISNFDTQVRTSRVDQMAAPAGVVDYSNAAAFLRLPKAAAYASAAALPAALANGMLAFQTDTVRLRVSR